MSSVPHPESYSAIPYRVTAYAVIDFGATGACTLQKWNPQTINAAATYSAAATSEPSVGSVQGSQLVKSISRTSTGIYVLTMQKAYQRLLGISPTWVQTSALVTTNLAAATSGIVSGEPVPLVSLTYATAAAYLTDIQTAAGGFLTFNTTSMSTATPPIFPRVVCDPTSGMRLILRVDLDATGTI